MADPKSLSLASISSDHESTNPGTQQPFLGLKHDQNTNSDGDNEIDNRSSSSSSSSSDDDGLGASAMFDEPAGFRQATPPPTFVDFPLITSDGQQQRLSLRLVGHNPLWGHHLWNAGRVLAERLQAGANNSSSSSNGDDNGIKELVVAGRDVLELGAGAGLPALVAWAVGGAAKVVITDYPDQDLIENLRFNIDAVREQMTTGRTQKKKTTAVADGDALSPSDHQIVAEGYLWGNPLSDAMQGGFDVVILADLLFNHSEHAKLVKSVQLALRRKRDCVALVSFTPYRPWLLEKDLAFFELAKEGGFEVTKIYETIMPEVMFKEDRGDELLRRTVYSYELRWNEKEMEE